MASRCRAGLPLRAPDSAATCREPVITADEARELGVYPQWCLYHARILSEAKREQSGRRGGGRAVVPKPPKPEPEVTVRRAEPTRPRPEPMSNEERAAVLSRAVRERGSMTKEEAADLLSVSSRTAGRVMDVARERGWLAPAGLYPYSPGDVKPPDAPPPDATLAQRNGHALAVLIHRTGGIITREDAAQAVGIDGGATERAVRAARASGWIAPPAALNLRPGPVDPDAESTQERPRPRG